MDLAALVISHPFWAWASVSALLLAAEVGTTSGYLLWPAASAAAVACLQFVIRPGYVVDGLVFAALTIITTVAARRLLPTRLRQPGPDINDRARALVGRSGVVAADFSGGRGRVFVDGAEWIAETGPDEAQPVKGESVTVLDVVGGGRLRVRAGS